MISTITVDIVKVTADITSSISLIIDYSTPYNYFSDEVTVTLLNLQENLVKPSSLQRRLAVYAYI